MATQIAHRNALPVRLTHWGVAAAFILLFGTGAAIYDRRPSFRIGEHVVHLPAIPSWLTIAASPKLVHYVSAALFVLCGIGYFIWGIQSGHFKAMILRRRDLSKLLPMQLYYFGIAKKPEFDGRYNPLQKAAYSAVLFVVTPLVVLSGSALLPFHAMRALNRFFPGGAKLWHVGLISALCLFVGVHLAMVVTTGLGKNLRRMV